MKSLKDYLTESKKTWTFKVKVAGDLPEKFESTLKTVLAKWDISLGEKTITPVQKLPLDFPQLENKEVHIFEIIANYPVTAPEITSTLHEVAHLNPECFVVRGCCEPTESYQEPAEDGYIVKLTSELENPTGDIAQDMLGEKRILSLFKDLTSYKNTKLNTEMDKPFKSDSVDSLLATKVMPDPKGIRK